MAGATSPAATNVDLADVFRRYGSDWLRAHRVPLRYRKVIQAITTCRTSAQGGRRQWCLACGYERYVYFSCRNRHCPQCQTRAKETWREARRRELLPVPYFHLVFTLPHQLNRLVLRSERNQRALLKLLFDATAVTLLQFGRHELGGQVGFTLLLHSWDQRLRTHLHLHGMIPSGALVDGGSRWIAGGRHFLFSVRALSKVYRGKYLDGLETLRQRGQLDLPPELISRDKRGWMRWMRCLRKHAWVVYAKPPFAGPEKLIDYLSRYTHRVAISNNRIHSAAGSQVQFSYRDRQDGDRRKLETLAADEFISRFLRHVLPDRFTRIRHYGFLANRNKYQALARIRQLLGVKTPPPVERHLTPQEWLQDILGIDPARCPCCGERLIEDDLPPFRGQLPVASTSPPPISFARPPP